MQIRRTEVWRTEPDGSWRVVGPFERTGRETHAQAVTRTLDSLGLDPAELLATEPPPKRKGRAA